MTTWKDNPSSFPEKDSDVLARIIKVRQHVTEHIFKVYEDVLQNTTFVTSIRRDNSTLFIDRGSEQFKLVVFLPNDTPRKFRAHAHRFMIVTVYHCNQRNQGFSIYNKPYFVQKFNLDRMGKVRKSALILRKKLEMFDIHQVLTS